MRNDWVSEEIPIEGTLSCTARRWGLCIPLLCSIGVFSFSSVLSTIRI